MKTLIFVCFITLLTSCAKVKVNSKASDWDWGISGGFCKTENPGNIVKADINSSGTNYQLSAIGRNAQLNRYASNNDANTITVHGVQGEISLDLNLNNISTTGTYKFGQNTFLGREINVSCNIGDVIYSNDTNMLSGSVMIDTLTNNHIHGLFTVTCLNGTQSVHITNGSFAGNY